MVAMQVQSFNDFNLFHACNYDVLTNILEALGSQVKPRAINKNCILIILV